MSRAGGNWPEYHPECPIAGIAGINHLPYLGDDVDRSPTRLPNYRDRREAGNWQRAHMLATVLFSPTIVDSTSAPGSNRGRTLAHRASRYPQFVFRHEELAIPLIEPDVQISRIRLVWGFLCQGGVTPFWSSFAFHSFVRPAPRAFFRPDRIFPSPSRAAAVKDGASSAPPKACP